MLLIDVTVFGKETKFRFGKVGITVEPGSNVHEVILLATIRISEKFISEELYVKFVILLPPKVNASGSNVHVPLITRLVILPWLLLVCRK